MLLLTHFAAFFLIVRNGLNPGRTRRVKPATGFDPPET
jgi:hypothetical protein